MLSVDSFLPFGKLRDNTLLITHNFNISCKPKTSVSCLVLGITSAYDGENAPKIRLALTASEQNEPFYESHDYRISKKGEYTRKSWRIPPIFMPGMTLTLRVDIPEGTTLYVKDVSMSHDSGAPHWFSGPRHNAHLGFWGLAPDNTMPAFELAAACGFPACIVVPKVTKDGVLVCIHDDTLNRTGRDKNGNPPSEEKVLIRDMTYEELLQWEFGSYKNEIYRGTKIPLLSDFFDLCAKTGMRPMFSTHPDLPTEKWLEVKEMLKKRGLLKNFHVKSFGLEVLQHAYSILGTEIEGYTLDVGTGKWTDEIPGKVLNSGIDASACRVGIEVRRINYTQEIAKAITDAGFFASVWELKRLDFDEYTKLMSWPHTEFTEDYHCSMGLNY